MDEVHTYVNRTCTDSILLASTSIPYYYWSSIVRVYACLSVVVVTFTSLLIIPINGE
jgi:hypothetical protein